jgi:hypothetical protein
LSFEQEFTHPKSSEQNRTCTREHAKKKKRERRGGGGGGCKVVQSVNEIREVHESLCLILSFDVHLLEDFSVFVNVVVYTCYSWIIQVIKLFIS